MKDRINQLDSIRGLASFTVFLHHMYLITPVLPLLLWYSPLRILVNGHGSVILFFVLSGFVLYLPFMSKNKNHNYVSYLIKRIFRIYIPYICAIFISVVAISIFSNYSEITNLSGWFNLFWLSNPTNSLIIEHLTLIGNVHSDAINTVIWSLVHEMRISIIFPLVAVMVRELNWKYSIVASMIGSSIAGINTAMEFQISNGFHTNYFESFHYLGMFICGALINKHRSDLMAIYQRYSATIKITVLLFALLAYVYFGAIDNLVKNPFSYIVGDYGITVAACLFIVYSIGSEKIARFLNKKPIIFIGKISYSLYLYHVVVLLSMIHALHNKLPVWMIDLISIPIVLFIAYVSWFIIENNSVKLGRIISNQFLPKQQKQVTVIVKQ